MEGYAPRDASSRGEGFEEESDGESHGEALTDRNSSVDMQAENSWRESFFNTWGLRFRTIVHGVTVLFMGLLLVHLFYAAADTSRGRLYTYLTSMSFIPERLVVGDQMAWVQSFGSVVVMVSACGLMSTRRYNHRTYVAFVGALGICINLAMGLPAYLAAFSCAGGAADPPEGCVALQTHWQQSWQEQTIWPPQQPPPVIQHVVRRASWHVGLQLCVYMGIAFFIPSAAQAAPVMLGTGLANAARAQILWSRNYGIDLISSTWPFHLTSILVMLAVCQMHSNLQREQFRMRSRLRQANEDRIEQLNQEKERLEYERIFALKRCSSSAVNERSRENSLRRDPASTGAALRAGGGQAAADARGLDRGGESVDGGSSRSRASSRASSSTDVRSERTCDGLALPRRAALMGRGGGPLSSSDATCSELDRLDFGCSYPSSLAGKERSQQEPSSSAYHMYRLLPQYYDEERDTSVAWLRSAQSRAEYHVSVLDSLLCGADGATLASEGVGVYIFVVDAAGIILAAPKPKEEPAHFYHSSLVAGAAVAAAGEMTIQSGKLLSLSNWSGHYAPPPSSLGVVFDRLVRLGMGNLKDVKLDLAQMTTRRRDVGAAVATDGAAKPDGRPSEGAGSRRASREYDRPPLEAGSDLNSDCSSDGGSVGEWDPTLALRS